MKTIKLLSYLFMFSSCAIISFPKPISIEEISNFESNALHDLELKIATSTNNLRIDIIRQTETDTDGDCETVDVPYHPLGFDLGNGLFYDLNDNISIRVDSILEVKKAEDYEILFVNQGSKITFKRKDNKHYKEWIGFSKKERSLYIDSINYQFNGIKVFRKDRLLYECLQEENETVLTYNKLRNSSISINEVEKNHFAIMRKKSSENFFLNDDTINLRNKYLVKKNNEENLIEIYTIGRKRNYLQYKIKKSSNKFMFYTRSNYGKKIDYNSSDISITYNDAEEPILYFKRVK